MTQHTHIAQYAALPEECPACAKMWDDVTKDGVDRILWDISGELETARALRDEYGEKEMYHHLTQFRDRALIAKARRTGIGR